jgi:uncharacterized protein YacL
MRNNFLYKHTTLMMITLQYIIALLISLLLYRSLSLLSVINSLFYVGMIIFLVSSFLYVLKLGFFDKITYSFRQFYKSFSPQGRQLGNDLDTMALPSEHDYSLTKPMLISSLIVLLTMLCFLLFYY